MHFTVLIKNTGQNLKPYFRLVKTTVLTSFFSAILIACTFQKYTPKLIDQLANVTKFELKDPLNKEFNQYLLNNGYPKERLPINQWGIDEFTYCALFFHPDLDVARAQWRAAQSAEGTVANLAVPTINANVSHSNDSDPTKKPFAFGLSIDIPIETANKRNLRIQNAHHLSQSAKLEVAQIAWQLRSNIAQTLTEAQFNQTLIRLLSEENIRREEIVKMYQKRVDAGAASNIELSSAKLQWQTTNSELNAALQNKLVLKSKLASNIGLPLATVKKMSLVNENQQRLQYIPNTDLQTTTLLNRLDVRIALERYAEAETKLKLEIAKQYPDLVISPGTAYEFGNNIWSLGFSELMTLLNKNKAGIAEAAQLREVEAAQFEALQTKVILDANIAAAEVNQYNQALDHQKTLLAQHQLNTQRMQHKLAAGDIDKLEMNYASLENISTEKNVALANFQLNKSLDKLEDTLQKPLKSDDVMALGMTESAFRIEGEK